MKKVMIFAILAGVIVSAAAFKKAGNTKGVTIVNTVEVQDFDAFKKAFDAGATIRDKAGIKVIGVFQSVDNANMVTVIEETASAESAKAFFSDPKAKEAMAKSGVISKPDLKILNKAE